MRLALLTMHTAERLAAEGLRTRDGHLAEALANRADVSELLLVDRPPTFAEMALRRRRRRVAIAAIPAIPSGATVMRPWSRAIVAPLIKKRYWWASAYDTSHLTTRSVERVMARLQDADAVISFVPSSVDLWRNCSVPVVFDVLDDWMSHPQLGGADPALFEAKYRETFSRAAAITAPTIAAARLARRFGRTATVIPNAVDVDAFSRRALSGSHSWLETLSRYPRPWMLYVGKLQERIDVDLVLALADSCAGSILLAGPVLSESWISPLRRSTRIQFLGDVPYSNVPGLMSAADVALIPHRVGEGENAGDAIKAYEYAAAGARIVATPIIGSERFGAWGIDVVTGQKEFVRHVVALATDERPLRHRLPPSALEHETWDARADALVRVIRSVIRVSSPSPSAEVAAL
jgi:hypothetical protein